MSAPLDPVADAPAIAGNKAYALARELCATELAALIYDLTGVLVGRVSRDHPEVSDLSLDDRLIITHAN